MDTTSLRLPDETFEELDRAVENSGMKQSQLLREAVEIYLGGVVPEGDYEQLQAEYESIQSERDELEKRVENLSNELASLRDKREELYDRCERIQGRHENLQDEHERIMEEKSERIRELERETKRKDKQNQLILEQKRENEALVAFANERRKIISGEKTVAPLHTRIKRSIIGYNPENNENQEDVAVVEPNEQ